MSEFISCLSQGSFHFGEGIPHHCVHCCTLLSCNLGLKVRSRAWEEEESLLLPYVAFSQSNRVLILPLSFFRPPFTKRRTTYLLLQSFYSRGRTFLEDLRSFGSTKRAAPSHKRFFTSYEMKEIVIVNHTNLILEH